MHDNLLTSRDNVGHLVEVLRGPDTVHLLRSVVRSQVHRIRLLLEPDVEFHAKFDHNDSKDPTRNLRLGFARGQSRVNLSVTLLVPEH